MDTDSVNIRTIYDIYCWTQCGSINTRALEMLTGKRVKEKYIYLFWNGEVLEF